MEGVSSAAVPQPRPADDPAGTAETRPARTGRRSLAAALLLGAVGAGLVLLAAGKTWATGSAASAGGPLPVSVSGKDVTALPDALALAGLAALLAVFAVRGAGRVLLSALLTLCGAGTVAASVSGAGDTTALRQAAAKVSGLTGTAVEHTGHTGWPWVTAAGGVLLLLAGVAALLCGGAWPAMSGRYERPGAPATRSRRAPDPDRPEEMWKALDRGEDPTADRPRP